MPTRLLSDREKIIATRARSRAIGRELRNRYEDTVHEAVPDDMLDILRAIDAKRAERT